MMLKVFSNSCLSNRLIQRERTEWSFAWGLRSQLDSVSCRNVDLSTKSSIRETFNQNHRIARATIERSLGQSLNFTFHILTRTCEYSSNVGNKSAFEAASLQFKVLVCSDMNYSLKSSHASDFSLLVFLSQCEMCPSGLRYREIQPLVGNSFEKKLRSSKVAKIVDVESHAVSFINTSLCDGSILSCGAYKASHPLIKRE